MIPANTFAELEFFEGFELNIGDIALSSLS